MDRIILGRSGIEVSRLNIGTGTHGWAKHSQQTALGVEGLAELLVSGFEQGVTFWDTADQYGSHPHIKRALRSVPRDKVVISTKTYSKRGASVSRDIPRFLRELKTDYLDIVLLHFITQDDWVAAYADAIEALVKAKNQGLVRAIGISSHNLGALQAAVNCDWLDVVLARINYAGVNMDGPVKQVVPVLRQLYAKNVGVYGMKVLGCGELTADPRKALDYVFGLGCVHAVTIGTSSIDELAQNIALVNEIAPQHPLS